MQLVCFAGSVAEGQAHGCNPYIRIILYYIMLCYIYAVIYACIHIYEPWNETLKKL